MTLSPKRVVAAFFSVGFLAVAVLGWALDLELVLVVAFATLLLISALKIFEVSSRLDRLERRATGPNSGGDGRAVQERDLRTHLDRRLQRTFQWTYQQTEALFSLFSQFEFRHPLPPMRGWAVGPDFANLLVAHVLAAKPRFILETGSGVSTLLIAYALQKNGTGRILSIDHEERYAGVTREYLAVHGVEDYAEVTVAPLVPTELDGGEWQWYDLDRVDPEKMTSIDMLIVDGPPGKLQPLSRYPAVPILFEKLSPNAVVFADDSNRADEQEVVERWHQRYGGFEREFHPTEKGATVLRRTPVAAPSSVAGELAGRSVVDSTERA